MTLQTKKELSTRFLCSRLQTGFTLIEMIVSIGIFLIGLLIIFGALISINDAARKARSTRIVMDNLSAAVDSMSRTIRVGSKFHCGEGGTLTTAQDCPMTDDRGAGGDNYLALESQQGDPLNSNDQIVYRLSGRSIERSTDSGVTFLPLTAPELSISSFKFYVTGTLINEDQPVITLLIRGTASTTERTSTTFDMQTTVAAYTPNISI